MFPCTVYLSEEDKNWIDRNIPPRKRSEWINGLIHTAIEGLPEQRANVKARQAFFDERVKPALQEIMRENRNRGMYEFLEPWVLQELATRKIVINQQDLSMCMLQITGD